MGSKTYEVQAHAQAVFELHDWAELPELVGWLNVRLRAFSVTYNRGQVQSVVLSQGVAECPDVFLVPREFAERSDDPKWQWRVVDLAVVPDAEPELVGWSWVPALLKSRMREVVEVPSRARRPAVERGSREEAIARFGVDPSEGGGAAVINTTTPSGERGALPVREKLNGAGRPSEE